MLTFREFIFRPERFTRCAVPPFILALVDVAIVVGFLHQHLNDFFMPFFCRPDEVIVRNIQFFPEFLEEGDDFIDVLNRRHPFCFCCALDFLAMFVRAGQEKDIVAAETVKPCQRIGNSCAIRMADVELGTRVINRGRNKILLLFCHGNSSSAGK